MTQTMIAPNVDRQRLRQQSDLLAEIADHLTRAKNLPRGAEEWAEAIEGIQNLIAALLHPESPTQPLTQLEFTREDHTTAERIAKFLGYSQYAYTSTSDLWGFFCMRENPANAEHLKDLIPQVPGGRGTERKHNATIIKTKELGFLVVYDLEDLRLDKKGRPTHA